MEEKYETEKKIYSQLCLAKEYFSPTFNKGILEMTSEPSRIIVCCI